MTLSKYLKFMLMLIPAIGASAQTPADSIYYPTTLTERFEGELFGGLALPIGEAEYGTKKIGWNAGAELRYNLRSLPIDVGLQYAHVATNASMTTYRQNSIKAVGDWNFHMPSIPRLTPFAGVGAGVDWCDDGTCFTFMPRVGVEYADFLRLTFATQFSRRYYSNAQVSLGFVIGGRKHREYLPAVAKSTGSAGWQNPAEPVVLDERALELQRITGERLRYQRRSTTYGVLGGVSLGIGAFLLTNGIVGLANNYSGNPATAFYGVAFIGTGGLLTLGSVPLFIACHKQGVQAARVSAKIEMLTTGQYTPTPALGLTVSF